MGRRNREAPNGSNKGQCLIDGLRRENRNRAKATEQLEICIVAKNEKHISSSTRNADNNQKRQRALQEQSKHQSPAEIAMAHLELATQSVETHVVVEHGQSAADRKEANMASHSKWIATGTSNWNVH